MRLDRFISKNSLHSHQASRLIIASGRVSVAGRVVLDARMEIDRFVAVSLDDILLQQQPVHYLMLHKPAGYLSATSDPLHPTVMELLPAPLRSLLHIGGRLDRSTSGLLILTNDGLWSRRLFEPKTKLPKVYAVRTALPICPTTSARFAEGIHFAFEGITTSPAELIQLSDHEARLTIYEGRYHQVKRMFHAVGNVVTALHRESVGSITLDPLLSSGDFRNLTPAEIQSAN
ncbi:MAG TPA: pseudouridine synthase [Pseudomonas xinjiangensis]|uniref:Pseudouridine synthase n=2 Tax=root TaxID=1 RepID=A0A7V1BM22_9GAMM|nr:pseudouridine synthase [Halopseudomonas xinjiangensis]HEC46399.1 pseudouridine synthase [Halopseudomonas xinjiangensis]